MALPNNWREKLDGASELHKRIVTGVLLALVAGSVIYAGGYVFICFIMLCSLMMLLEWQGLNEGQSWIWQAIGVGYILLPSICLLMIRTIVFAIPDSMGALALTHVSPLPLVCLIATVAATDIGAYAAGRKFGKHKLAPKVSPKKTWEGLGGGMLCAGIFSAAVLPLTGFPQDRLVALILGLCLAVVAQMGDLFESWIKRRAGAKDSGKSLPGHGGVLDRVDGLLFAAPIYLLLTVVFGGHVV